MTSSVTQFRRLDGSNENLVILEQASGSSQVPKMTQKSPKLIVNIAILVSVIIFGVFIFCTHLKLVNQLATLVESQQSLTKDNEFSTQDFKSPQLFTFGGEDLSETRFLSSGSHLNSSTGEWRSINNMPVAATQMCGAVSGNQIYLFGGLGGNRSHPFGLKSATYYDCLTDTYTILPPMPEVRDSCAAAVLNGNIYIVGGATYNVTNSLTVDSSSVIRYNIETSQWSIVSSMSTPRYGAELVELGGRLYAIGGQGLSSVEVYDPSEDRWSAVASTRSTHYNFGATAHEGKIYLIDWQGFEVYSPDIDRWDNLTIDLEFHSFHNLLSMNGKLWAMGGTHQNGDTWDTLKSVYSYDFSTGRFTKQRDMDVARQFSNAFVVNH